MGVTNLLIWKSRFAVVFEYHMYTHYVYGTNIIFILLKTKAAGADMGCGDWLNDTPLHIAITYG